MIKQSSLKAILLYSKLRPYLRKILVAPENGICTSELVPFSSYKPECNLYLLYLLKSSYIDFTVNNATYWMKMPRVSAETMVNLVVPLPPVSEQKRRVAKVEELLSLCDKLKERGMRTKSWTPLLILTKSEPVLYRAQSS